MKIGPRIIASESIRNPAEITDAWKIAAVAHQTGWHWLCGYEAGQAIHRQLFSEGTRRRTLSAVQGLQRWDGMERWVLYVRLLPAGVA